MLAAFPNAYRGSLFMDMDERFQKTLTGSSILGVLVLLAVFLAPVRELTVTNVEEIPERFARLILEEPAPPAPVVAEPAPVPPAATDEPAPAPPAPEPKPKVEVQPPPPPAEKPGARRDNAMPPPKAGDAGRAKAKAEVSATLSQATASLSSALEGVSTSLTKSKSPSTRRAAASGSARVSRARSARQLAAVDGKGAGGVGDGTGSSSLRSDLIRIDAVGGGSGGGGAGGRAGGRAGGGAGVGGSGNGSYRTNASLLAVVRKYAAGIEYCYDNELKKNPSLRGKLVVAITVAASGAVTDANIVQDTLASSGVRNCALSQIRDWRFPSIPVGVVTFKTPFVFTPPK